MNPDAMTGMQPGRGFAMVPAWLAWKKPSANALLVYVHLALFGTFNPGTATYEQCRPSKRTLAQGDPKRGYPGTGLGEQTVGRALRELERLGAIKGEPSFDPVTGAQGPTVYRLLFGQVVEEEAAAQTPVSPVTPPPPHITPDTGGGVTDDKGAPITTDMGGVSQVIHNQEPSTQNPLTQSSDHPSDDRPRGRKRAAKSVQPTLTGETPQQAEPREPTTHDRAMGLARGWIKRRADQNTPVIGSNALHKLCQAIKPALEAGYADNEVKVALDQLGVSIPTRQALDRQLAANRTGSSAYRSGAQRITNRHLDQITPEERERRNPFAHAVRSSDVIDAGVAGAA